MLISELAQHLHLEEKESKEIIKRWSHGFLLKKFVGFLDHYITFHYLYASLQSAS